MVNDVYVSHTGDDIALLFSHQKGTGDEGLHKLAWDAFVAGTEVAKEQGLYGAGQDLLKDAFSGNVKGMGPGVAEMEIEEREAETVVIFMADKTASGAWNLPLYKIFADPFNTVGLVIAGNMHGGFSFEVHDVKESCDRYSPHVYSRTATFRTIPGDPAPRRHRPRMCVEGTRRPHHVLRTGEPRHAE